MATRATRNKSWTHLNSALSWWAAAGSVDTRFTFNMRPKTLFTPHAHHQPGVSIDGNAQAGRSLIFISPLNFGSRKFKTAATEDSHRTPKQGRAKPADSIRRVTSLRCV